MGLQHMVSCLMQRIELASQYSDLTCQHKTAKRQQNVMPAMAGHSPAEMPWLSTLVVDLESGHGEVGCLKTLQALLLMLVAWVV